MTKLVRQIAETLSEVAAAAAEAEAFAAGPAGADREAALRIGLAADELAANALVHGAMKETRPDITVEVWSDAELVHLSVSATGPRFDPRDHQAPSPAPDAIGGRGLTLVLAFADRLAYRRDGDRNVTVFSVRKTTDAPDR